MIGFIDLPSNNHADRGPAGVVDTLVLHHTAQPLDVSLELLRFGAVSAHYVVDTNGDIYRLVDEVRTAWHAGLSWWRDASGLNATSIGIEIVNANGNEYAYPAPQQDAVISLCRAILNRHPRIVPRNVVGHSDIAPHRKDDPGVLFFWRALAAAGVGLWSEATASAAGGDPAHRAGKLLRRFGYASPHRYGRVDGRFVQVDGPPGDRVVDVVDVGWPEIIAAFQRHYRPARVDGVADPETMARLRDLLHQAGERDD